MSNWIKCSERLPDDGVEVFAFEKYSKAPFVGHVKNGMWYPNTEFLYVDGDAYLSDNLCQDLVTHWQPIMELPQDESE